MKAYASASGGVIYIPDNVKRKTVKTSNDNKTKSKKILKKDK